MGRDCHKLDGGHGGDGGGGTISSSKLKRNSNGCMAAFYHLFDFHLTIDSPSRSKGLRLIQESLPSTTYKEKQSLNIPVSMRVRTETGTKSSRLRALATDDTSEICNSPGSKTPNLVARLMGLDLLPDKTDDLNHSSRLTKKGTRSLPVSPRISSARKSDFDIHRLSLQLNKENKHQEFGCSRLKQDQEENRSPRDYARQIVKQIKERAVTRRVVGMDITNSVKNRDARPSHELRRDTTVSCSPRTRFSDKENKPNTSRKPNTSQKPNTTTMILVASVEKQSKKRVKQRQLRPINQCTKAESETRFTQRPIKPSSPTSDIRILSGSRNVKAKPLHKKKFKKIPKSKDLENISGPRPPQKQINETDRLKSNDHALSYGPKVARLEGNRIDSEQNYITRIMNLTNTDSPPKMFSPSIFQNLEHLGEYRFGSLTLRCNRRLLFDLLNEILIETVELRNYNGLELISELCSAVARYSSEYCPGPEEIALMDVDHHLRVTKKKVKEEGEEIIAEIEREIIDSLVREMSLCPETTSDGKKSY